MTHETYLIRARLERLRVADLTDAVLASAMPFDDTFTAFALFAHIAMQDAREGRVPGHALRTIAADPGVPDAVYDALYDLVTAALLDVLAVLPRGHKPH